DVARKVADEGIVLLQNKNGILPMALTGGKRVLVVGENAIKMMTVGGGSSSLKVQREVLPLEGIEAVCKAAGATCDYARGYVGDINQSYNGVVVGRDLRDDRSKEELIVEAVEKAKGADYVIYVGGLNKSDYQDCEG
ncbi:glycoside hydrolase family 3 C-terminal domain-containing protein, partial [Parabacteroides distasonis]